MKKTFLSIASLITFGLVSHAQVSIIPKVGLSLGNYAFQEEDNKEEGQKSAMGLVAGVGFNLPISEDGFFSLQPELLYIQKGLATKNTVTETEMGITYSESSKSKLAINFLEIPVLAKINFGGDVVKAYVNAGPSFAFGLGGKDKYEITASTEDGQDVLNDIPADIRKSEFKIRFAEEPENGGSDDVLYLEPKYNNRIDIGVQFGGGVGFQVGPGALVLDVRYGLGLTNLSKNVNEDGFEQKADGKSRTFAFTLGYAIPLGGK